MNQLTSTKALQWWQRIRFRGKQRFESLSIKKRGKIPISYLIILPEHATESDLAKRFLVSMRNALGPRKKRNMNKNKTSLSTLRHHLAKIPVFSLLKINILSLFKFFHY